MGCSDLMAAQDRVQELVVPAAFAPLDRPNDTFARKANFFKHMLFGSVLGIGEGLGMTAVTLRFATLGERAALEGLQLRSSIALPTYRDDVLRHPEVIYIPPSLLEHRRVRVAEQAGVLVGFVTLLAPDNGLCELDGLFVDPGWWRKGIGSTLIRDARDTARAENAHAIHVVANPDAVEFYLQCGFVTVGETQTQFGPAPRMQLALNPRR
jgi:GNAT superfamily N-acetyltransferase